MQTARERLDSVLPRLGRAATLQEELRDASSASDLRAQARALWSLRRNQSDLGRRLSLKCRELEAEIEMLPQFKERYDRFMEWADDLEKRMEDLQQEQDGGTARQQEQVRDYVQSTSSLCSLCKNQCMLRNTTTHRAWQQLPLDICKDITSKEVVATFGVDISKGLPSGERTLFYVVDSSVLKSVVREAATCCNSASLLTLVRLLPPPPPNGQTMGEAN